LRVDFFKSIDTELIVTASAVIVAGMAAVLGIWMERDARKPPRYAWALSALILLATAVSLMQSLLDKREQDEIKEDMARLLATMDKIASESNDPALLDLVKTEINAQSRDNPEVVEKVAARVEAAGGDAEEMLAKHLDAADAEKVARRASKPKESKPKHESDAEPEVKDKAKEGKQAVAAPSKDDDDPELAAKRAAAQQAAAAAAQAGVRGGRPGMPPVPVPTPAPEQPAGGPEAIAAPATPAATVRPPAGVRGAPPTATVRPGVKPTAVKKPAPRKPRGE
jgi:hypothetical protein